MSPNMEEAELHVFAYAKKAVRVSKETAACFDQKANISSKFGLVLTLAF